MIFSRRVYNYLLSRIKPVNSYLTRDYTPDYFAKIAHEVYGTIHRLIYTDEMENQLAPFDFHTGLTCLLAMKQRILADADEKDTISRKTNMYQIRNSLFKLLEHRRILYDGMKWYEREWDISSNQLTELRQQYSNCLSHMEQTCMMILKDDATSQQENFPGIAERLSEQYRKEKPVLQDYFKYIHEWYYKRLKEN